MALTQSRAKNTYAVFDKPFQDLLFALTKYDKPECGPMPNVMAALPNIGGALCSTPHSLADAHCWSTVQ